jgi:hypothetical protein
MTPKEALHRNPGCGFRSGSGYRSGLTYQEKERKMNDDLLKELWNKGAAYMAQEYT